MDTVTYPNAAVERELNEKFVACRLESAKNGELARKLNVRWLPGLVVADADERPAHVVIGFLPPGDIIAELTFGRAISAMGQKRYDDAHALFREVAESNHDRAPEAYFWWGISRFRQTKDFQSAVGEPWSKILERWPTTEWARKVGYGVGTPP